MRRHGSIGRLTRRFTIAVSNCRFGNYDAATQETHDESREICLKLIVGDFAIVITCRNRHKVPIKHGHPLVVGRRHFFQLKHFKQISL